MTRQLTLRYPVLNQKKKGSVPINLDQLKQKQKQEQIYTNVKNNQKVESKDMSFDFGIAFYIFYCLLYIYVYASSYYKGGISLNASISKAYTISEAFQFSEKRITTILIVLTIAILQGLFAIQNFYPINNSQGSYVQSSADYQKISVISITYLMLISWLLLMFVWPNEHKAHSLVAVIIMICTLYISMTINNLYHNFYDSNEIQDMQNVTYVIITSFTVCFLIMIIRAILIVTGISISIIFQNIIQHLIGISEILFITMFSVFVIIFSQMPALPNSGDLVCYIQSMMTQS